MLYFTLVYVLLGAVNALPLINNSATLRPPLLLPRCYFSDVCLRDFFNNHFMHGFLGEGRMFNVDEERRLIEVQSIRAGTVSNRRAQFDAEDLRLVVPNGEVQVIRSFLMDCPPGTTAVRLDLPSRHARFDLSRSATVSKALCYFDDLDIERRFFGRTVRPVTTNEVAETYAMHVATFVLEATFGTESSDDESAPDSPNQGSSSRLSRTMNMHRAFSRLLSVTLF